MVQPGDGGWHDLRAACFTPSLRAACPGGGCGSVDLRGAGADCKSRARWVPRLAKILEVRQPIVSCQLRNGRLECFPHRLSWVDFCRWPTGTSRLGLVDACHRPQE